MVSSESFVPRLGARVLVKDKDFGTVKYIGPLHVDKTNQTWYGVDWDEPGRGKHDGTLDGVRYFHASAPTSGSFLKPHPSVDFGTDARTALEQQYLSEDQLIPDAEEVSKVCKMFGTPFYEVCGFEKQHTRLKNLGLLKFADLKGKRVFGGKLSGAELPRLEQLDLCENLVSSWHAVHEVVSDLPQLSFLELSRNRISFDDETPPTFTARGLAVNSCALNWEKLLEVGKMFPELVNLSCVTNEIRPRAACGFGAIFGRLEELDISSNPVESPEAFRVLGELRNLRLLRAASVGLTSLKLELGDFPRLADLNLHNNVFTSLASVDELRKVGTLRCLRLGCSSDEECAVHYFNCSLVAKLPQVTKVNGAEVAARDRRDAELDYLRLNSKEWFESESDPARRAAFLAEHSNYPEIIAKHGEPARVQPTASNLSARLLTLTIVTPDHPLARPLTRRLPMEMPVGKLRGALARSCRKQVTELRMYVCPCRLVDMDADLLASKKLQALDVDDRALSYYVSDSDVIVVKW